MEEKVKLMVFYRVSNNHPRDLYCLTGEEAFTHLTEKEDIIQMYLAQTESERGVLGKLPTFLDYIDDFNSQDMDNGSGMWLALISVPYELVENYLNK